MAAPRVTPGPISRDFRRTAGIVGQFRSPFGVVSVVPVVSFLRSRLDRIKFLGLIAAPEGVAALQKVHPEVPIHLAAVDSHLDEHSYIVPGLGDAGDRMYGTK